MPTSNYLSYFSSLATQVPQAYAIVRGSYAHPHHAGDLPPLFGNNGYALSMFLTTRFSVSEIIGRTVILHSAPDDFTSQPAGNSGVKIACGVIVAP